MSSHLFSYFKDGPRDAPGVRFATSRDGLRFEPVRGGAVLLSPEVGEGKLMRDPFIMRGVHQGDPWHLLWTTAWSGVTLGHATSHDLIHWSPQVAIPVMSSVPGTRNVWAPEMIWDPSAGCYVILWSSTVRGLFEATADSSEDGHNHRLWYVTTTDFESFSAPRILWDPGFSVIDATYLSDAELGLHLVIKDETLHPQRKHLRIARAMSPTGPFVDLSGPFTPDWVEGPTVARLGEWVYVYYDQYREGRYGAARTRDLRHWYDVTAEIALPAGARHGAITPIGQVAAERLNALFG